MRLRATKCTKCNSSLEQSRPKGTMSLCVDCKKEYERTKARKRYAKHSEQILAYQKIWLSKHGRVRTKNLKSYPKYLARRRQLRRDHRNSLTDQYIRELLAKNIPLSARDIPEYLVEIKRVQLALKRNLRGKTNG